MPQSNYKFSMGGVFCSTHSKLQLCDELLEMLNGDISAGNLILYLNPHIFNLAQDDPALRRALDRARIVSADGMAIVWCSPMFLQGKLSERCNMTEVFREYLADPRFPACKAVLIGATEREAEMAAASINAVSLHMQVVRAEAGFSDAKAYLNTLADVDDFDVVLLGMGTPKSEMVAEVLADNYPNAIIWHIGGGTIMFYAGTLKEAPAWMRRNGLQWIHRLALEPGRMWRRYLPGNASFLCSIFRLWLRRGLPWGTKPTD